MVLQEALPVGWWVSVQESRENYLIKIKNLLDVIRIGALFLQPLQSS